MTVIKKKEQNRALEKAVQNYLNKNSDEAKAAVVKSGEAMVNYYAGLYSSGKVDEDLKQAGYEGILKALRRYDPGRDVMFSTFASYCIIGEIRHELRGRGPFKVPEWMKGLQARIIKATEDLAQQNGAMPTLKEIARRVNVNEEGIAETMQIGCVSLDEVDLTKVRSLRYESFKLPIEDKIVMQMSLEKMDKLQQQVIKLIFFEGLTQEQVAKRLGLNQRKVSRLLHRGLDEMRFQIG